MSKAKWTLGVVVVVLGVFLVSTYAVQRRFETGAALMKEGRFADGVEHLRPLAELGHSPSQAMLGRALAFGWGSPKDFNPADAWIARASRHPFPAGSRGELEYFIGKDMIEGVGANPDAREGKRWLEAAQQNGYRGPLTP